MNKLHSKENLICKEHFNFMLPLNYELCGHALTLSYKLKVKN